MLFALQITKITYILRTESKIKYFIFEIDDLKFYSTSEYIISSNVRRTM